MKKLSQHLVSGLLTCSLLLTIVPLPVQAQNTPVKINDLALTANTQVSALGSKFAWADFESTTFEDTQPGKTAAIWYMDLATGAKKKIANKGTYQPLGLKVLGDGVYFVNKSTATIHKYNFSTQSLDNVGTINDPLLSNFELNTVEIGSSTFFKYSLKHKNYNYVVTFKYLNTKTNKIWGADTASESSNGTVSLNEGTKILPSGNPENAIIVNGNYLFEVKQKLVLNGSYADQLSSYDVETGASKQVSFPNNQKLFSLATYLNPTNQTSAGDYLIAEFTADNNQPNTIWRRFNYKTGELGAQIIEGAGNWEAGSKPVGTTILAGAIENGYAIWYKKGAQTNQYFWYNVNTNTSCEIQGWDDVHGKFYLSENYAYWRTQGKLGWTGRKLECKQSESTPATPSKPAEEESKLLVTPITQPAGSGYLIKSKEKPSVYYVGTDGKRYVFYNGDIFSTWYKNFSGLKTVTSKELSKLPLGGNVTYRPGTMVKIESNPAVYIVDRGGVLRGITNEAVAKNLYGSKWSSQIKTIPDFLFVNYTLGESINSSEEFNLTEVRNSVSDISTDKGL